MKASSLIRLPCIWAINSSCAHSFLSIFLLTSVALSGLSRSIDIMVITNRYRALHRATLAFLRQYTRLILSGEKGGCATVYQAIMKQ